MEHDHQNHTNIYSVDDKLTIVLLGNQQSLKSEVGKKILKRDFNSQQVGVENFENEDFVVINTPNNCSGKDILDLVARSHPGPHAFLLVLDEGEEPEQELHKWEKVLQQRNMYHYTIVILDNKHFGKESKMTCLDINNMEGLAETYKSSIHRQYSYTYTGYSEEAVKQRITQLENGSTAIKKPRQDADGINIEHEGEPTQGSLADQSRSLTLVLLGESGSGKSASGNTILGQEAFLSQPSSTAITIECKAQSKLIYGTELKVIDTPDFFDEDLQQQSKHVMECKQMCQGDLCVYLLVIQIGRFTEGERDILERLERALGKVRDRTIILFTHGDDLESDHIDDYVRNTNTHLQKLIRQCGDRYQVFNNKEKSGEQQVKELMEKIAALVVNNDHFNVFPGLNTEKSLSF